MILDSKEETLPEKDVAGGKNKKPAKKGGKKRSVKKKPKTSAAENLAVPTVQSEFGESYFVSEKPNASGAF